VDPEQKPVELGFWQRKGPGKFDRILRGQDHEWLRQRISLAIDRDLPLLHRLQEAGLRFGTAAVDFIGQDDLAHDRTRMKGHRTSFQVIHIEASDVRWQDIRGELDALEQKAQRARKRVSQGSLAHPGHILDQTMAPA